MAVKLYREGDHVCKRFVAWLACRNPPSIAMFARAHEHRLGVSTRSANFDLCWRTVLRRNVSTKFARL
jgi:hypothetical protein